MRPLVALALLLAAPPLPPNPGGGPGETRQVDRAARAALDAWDVPGCAVAVVRGDAVAHLAGYGVRDVSSGRPVTPDTVFPLGSCSKGFTVALIGRLIDEGKMGWDDPVRKHLPAFRLADPEADREVRVRDLLCHRAGLGSHDLLWYRAPWSPEERVRRLGLLPPARPFRSGFEYQSTAFTAAGLACATAGGGPWDELLRKRILEPIGMAAALTSREALLGGDVAAPHGDGPAGEPVRVPRYNMDTPEPAGSIHASAREVARWLSFQVKGGQVKGGPIGSRQVVSAASLAEARKPHSTQPLGEPQRSWFAGRSPRYGLAWVLHDHGGEPVLSHGGAIDGFRAHLCVVPGRDLGVVVLANRHQTWMPLALTNTLLDQYLGRPARDWNAYMRRTLREASRADARGEAARLAARKAGTRPSAGPAAYVGDYDHPAYGTVQVRRERGQLVWQWNSFHSPLLHWEDDQFTVALDGAGSAEVSFRVGRGGAVEAMKVGGMLGAEFTRRGGKGR